MEKYQPGLDDFDQALARGRNDAFIHAGRGMALEKLERPAEADLAFDRAHAPAPGEPEERRTQLHGRTG